MLTLLRLSFDNDNIMTYSLQIPNEIKGMSEIIITENPDLLEPIFRYLDPASVKAASQVSR